MQINIVSINSNNEQPIHINLPLKWIQKEFQRGIIHCGDALILGLPIYQFYYVVYNTREDTLTFVNLTEIAGYDAIASIPTTNNQQSSSSRGGTISTFHFSFIGYTIWTLLQYLF